LMLALEISIFIFLDWLRMCSASLVFQSKSYKLFNCSYVQFFLRWLLFIVDHLENAGGWAIPSIITL
jgi:hypothetical protein